MNLKKHIYGAILMTGLALGPSVGHSQDFTCLYRDPAATDYKNSRNINRSLISMQTCLLKIGNNLPNTDEPSFIPELEKAVNEIQESRMLEFRHPSPPNPKYVEAVETEKGTLYIVDWSNYKSVDTIKVYDDCWFLCEKREINWAPKLGPKSKESVAHSLVRDLEMTLKEDGYNLRDLTNTQNKITEIKKHYNLK